MHTSSGRSGGDPRDDRGGRGDSASRGESALRAIERLALLDDGSGFILGELQATLAGIDPDVLDLPSVRVASLPLLAEVQLGLGDDAQVADLLSESVDRAADGDRAARAVVLRILRSVARMDAVELRGVVKRLLVRAEGTDPVLVTGLRLGAAVLDAVGPGAHPLAFPRLPERFTDEVLMAGDPDLLCFFADVEIAVHGREKDNLRMAAELDLPEGMVGGAGAAGMGGPGGSRGRGGDAGRGCGGAAKTPRGGDFGDAAPGV